MAEARLRIVDELFAETPLPPDATDTQRKRREIDMATVQRYVPAIMKRGGAKREAEILATAGARTIDDLSMLAQVRQEHAKELQSLALHYDDARREARGGGFWRGVGAMGVVAVLLCAGTGFGVFYFFVESQYATAAITQAVTRPSAEAMRNAMQPQEGGGFQ